MLLIRDSHVDRAIHLIDTSGAADILERAMKFKPQGRKRQLRLRTWFIGAYLAIENAGSFKNTRIRHVLTHGLSFTKQHELGVRFQDNNGEVNMIGKSSCDYLTRHMPKRLAYTAASSDRWNLNLTAEQMDERKDAVQEVIGRLLQASLVVRDSTSHYALDGSGTWSCGKSKRAVKDDKDVRESAEVADQDLRVRDEVADGDATANDVLPASPASRKVLVNHDPQDPVQP